MSLSACLITEEGEIREVPNYPPAIQAGSGSSDCIRPLGSIINLPIPESGDVENLCFEVEVLDVNEEQELEYLTFVNFPAPGSEVDSGPVPANGSFRRTIQFTIPSDRWFTKNECHKVELFVSGQFVSKTTGGVKNRNPVIEGDVASTIWWVRAISESNPNDIGLGSCLEREAL